MLIERSSRVEPGDQSGVPHRAAYGSTAARTPMRWRSVLWAFPIALVIWIAAIAFLLL